MGLIPGWRTKILHVSDQLSPQATARDPECHNERSCVLQLRLNVAKQINIKKKNKTRCPSADEWIRKLWYIYTMEFYSAIKKNTFE